ncbi:MAG TPA: glycosyltransferase family 4 protein [Pyrinomonadaceae bacterium]|nr:glycosyltransferase family 4 protein [Pyrinomonadaceae bacterium]
MSKKESDKQGKEPNESGLATSDAQAHPSKPVRVLVVAPSFDILGGQSVQAARLIERLRQETSLEVDFLPINPRLPGFLRKLQSIRYLRTLSTSIVYVAALLRRVPKYDVIHIFSASYFSFLLAPTPAILISKLYGKKTLLNYHSGEAEDHLQRWSRSAVPTIRLVNELIVPSEYLVRVFDKFNLRARPIYNLIETTNFHFRERQPLRPVFLSNRNFERHYGVDVLLRCFALISQSIPEARLIVAGDGPQRASLERLGRDLKLVNVEFVGRVRPEYVTELYDKTDIFLNGSEIDNQPLSILEAFACGLPVVTTDAGGIPYMVEHEKTGLLTRCGDYQALADGAIRLLAEPALAQSIIHNGRNECRKFSWDVVRKQWLSLYHGLALEDQSQRHLQIGDPGSSESC